jgi:protein TonB
MEPKKNPKYDVYRQSKLFFSIGLATSMLMVTTAIEWKTVDTGDLVQLVSSNNDQYEEVLDIPPTTQPPPPPPQQVYMPNIVEVPDEEVIINDLDINLDIEIKETTVIEEYEYNTDAVEAPEEEEAEEIFLIVEEFPEPEAGMKKFYEYIAENMNYPTFARANSITGKVFVEFIIESDGTMRDVNVLKGIGGGCDEEAVRVIEKSADFVKWKPGNQRGVPVNVRMVLPLTFSLD